MNRPLDPKNVGRLLIRGTNWVGDAVMSLPALEQVRREFSHAQIILLVVPWVSGVYEECEYIDELILYERHGKHRGIRGKIQLIQEIRQRDFDAALLFQNAFEAAFLAWLSGIRLRAGYDRDGRRWLLTHPIRIDPRIQHLHQCYYYLDLIDQLLGRTRTALELADPGHHENRPVLPRADISIPVGPSRKEAARQRLKQSGTTLQKRLVGVNPGAYFGSAKRWLSDRFAELLDRLIERNNAEVVIFGASNELQLAQDIQSHMRCQPLIFSGKTSLAELIAMISVCDLFITNDSGPMHLAAALQVPTLAIFGPTDENATGPMSPTAVLVKKKVECSPCLLRECPIDHRCMTRISVDEVYVQAVEMLRTAIGRRPSHAEDAG
jgi:heptosyltransferase II